MNTLFKPFFLSFFLLVFALSNQVLGVFYMTSWENRTPPTGGAVVWSSIAVANMAGTVLAAANTGRLYTSDDNGSTWTETQPAGDTDQDWSAVAIGASGELQMAAARNGRLYLRGTGDRDHPDPTLWFETQPVGDTDQDWSMVAIATGVLIAAVDGGRMYSSADLGATWTETQPAGDTDQDWSAVATNGSVILAGARNGRAYIGIADLFGGTVSWTETQPAGDTTKNWSTASINPNTGSTFLGIDGGRLYTSTISDISTTPVWTETQPAGDANQAWSAVATSGQTALAATDGGRIYIKIGENTWTETQPAGDTNQAWSAVAVNGDGTLPIVAADILYIGAVTTPTPDAPDNFQTTANTTASEKFDGHALYRTTEIQKSGSTTTPFPHGVVQVGDRFYVGLRSIVSSNPSKLFSFTNLNDISSYQEVTTTGYANIESMTYDAVHNRIYAVATATSNVNVFSIISINPDDISDWEAVYTAALSYDTSSAITTDGTYVYGVSYTNPPIFFKIRISDWTVVATNTWTNGRRGHAASLVEYADRSELYFTSSFAGGAFAKVNPTDLSYTEIVDLAEDGDNGLITDDIYCRKITEAGATCYVGSEDTVEKQLFVIDTATMTKSVVTAPGSYGLFAGEDTLYNLAHNTGLTFGYIVNYAQFDESSPVYYAFPGEVPNEFFESSTGRKFFTNWGSDGYLKEYIETSDIYATSDVSVSWESNISNITYTIELSTDGIDYDPYGDEQSQSTLTLSDLAPNTQYWIRVVANNGEESSAPSVYNFTTAAFVPAAASSVPSFTSVSSTSTTVTLAWNGTSPEYYVKTGILTSGWIDDTSYVFTGLTCGQSYDFRVKGRNSDGVSTVYSASTTVTTAACDSDDEEIGGGQSFVESSGSYITLCRVGDVFSIVTGRRCTGILPDDVNKSMYSFTKPLKMGMTDLDVKALQQYLNLHGFTVSLTGLGSKGNETTYFGIKTKTAVIKFQLAHNLIGDGVVGPRTRAMLK